MYGSFVKGEGDEWSDVEFWIFVEDEELEKLDRVKWCNRVSPALEIVRNEYGADVAIFKDSLIRGEFHFHPACDTGIVSSWGYLGAASSEVIVVDRDGRLQQSLIPKPSSEPGPWHAAEARTLCLRFVNWMLLGHNVLQRGEIARAHSNLGFAHMFLLQMARVVEDHREHWLTPSKGWEREMSQTSVSRLARCTAMAERETLLRAYSETWHWGLELIRNIDERFDCKINEAVLTKMTARLTG